jgi:hypothetical protein
MYCRGMAALGHFATVAKAISTPESCRSEDTPLFIPFRTFCYGPVRAERGDTFSIFCGYQRILPGG